MASIRDQLQTALVARLATISGCTAALRGLQNDLPASGFSAVVAMLTEDKVLLTSAPALYSCTLQLLIFVTVAIDDAHAVTDGGNAFRYLDRMVVLVEKTIHAPDAWGPAPLFTDVAVLGHDVSDPSDENTLTAEVRVSFTYRHTAEDPEV
jgi:hypothetical protein